MKLASMFTPKMQGHFSVATQETGSVTVATQDTGLFVTATKTIGSAAVCHDTSGRTARDVVLDAMKKQFYKVYGRMYDEAQEGGSGLPTKEKYDQYVLTLQ